MKIKQTEEKKIDIEMRAWLMILAAAKNPPGIFGRKRAEKELRESLEVLNGCDMQDFAGRYIELCLTSRSYGSTLMNLVPLNEQQTEDKLLKEINLVTHDYPARFGLAESCTPLRDVMLEELKRRTK